MDNEILQNIWQNLSANNLTDTEFEEWTETFMNDTEVQENVHEYLFDNDLTESSFEEWSTNIGLKKKRPTRFGITIGRWWIGVQRQGC